MKTSILILLLTWSGGFLMGSGLTMIVMGQRAPKTPPEPVSVQSLCTLEYRVPATKAGEGGGITVQF